MADLMPTPALAFGAVVIVACLYWLALPRPLQGIPYYKPTIPHPLGDALSFLTYRNQNGDMFGLLAARLRELNTPIMQIFVQPLERPWVIVSDPQEANDVFTRRTKEFDRSKYFGQILEPLLPQNHMHLPTGPEWLAHRRLIKDAMSSSFLHKVVGPLFWTSTLQLIELWRIKMQLAQGQSISAAEDIYTTALEIVWHATFGVEPGSSKAQIEILRKQLLDSGLSNKPRTANAAVEFPRARNPAAFDAILTLTDSLDIPTNSIAPRIHHLAALNLSPRLTASTKHKDRYIEARLEQAKEKICASTPDEDENFSSVIDLVLHREKLMAAKEGREPIYDSKVIADELFGFLFAAHDTTSTTLRWTIKYLAADRRVQSKLRSALQASFANAHATGEQPSIEDIIANNIPYLDAVMAEALRKSLTAVAVSRTSLVDTTLLGHYIPKGTTVFFVNSGPGTQTPAIPIDDSRRSKTSLETKRPAWDPANVELFMPERWLKTVNSSEHFDPQAGPSLPFGGGPRGCFGRKWAELELRVLLTLIIWNFELLPPPAELASFKAIDKTSHQPRQCYVRLAEVK